jgi:hypothetical protein
MRSPGLIRRITKLLQSTVHTLRLPGHTNLPPMMNQLMRKRDPPVLRNDLHQIPLHLLRRSRPRSSPSQLQPPRQAHHMRVDNNPNRNPIPRPQHHIPGLPRHPRQPQNLLHRLRNLPPKLLHHNPRRAFDRLRFIPKKSRSPNQLFKFGQGSSSHRLRCRKRLEQRRSHQVHPNIRTLRRQNRSDGQLPSALVVQRANHSWISLPKRSQNRRNPLRRSRLHCLRARNLRRHRYPRRSSISAAGTRTQLKIGKSFNVYKLISVSRSASTSARKSSGKLVSNATVNSWSSIPNE